MFTSSSKLDLSNKKVLIRVDFNVPLKNGAITEDTRIRACLPVIKQCLDADAKIMMMSHLGRPTEGEYDEQYSLAPVAARLSELLDREVVLIKDWLNKDSSDFPAITLLENVRFEVGEKADDEDLARHMANLCDVFINDAFATAHRAQASTHGVAKYAPVACAGPLLEAEVTALSKALGAPEKPLVAVVGGSKVSTKLTILNSLSDKVDQLIVGGGIANTFLKAAGYNIGQSLHEADLVSDAAAIMEKIKQQGGELPLPHDVVCAKEFSEQATATTKGISEVEEDDMILDVGPVTRELFDSSLSGAKTIVWNGPLGVFEFDQFAAGTEALGKSIANSDGFSIAGGGDTLAAIAKFKLADDISYISTAGGAFLEFLEGRELPAIAILEEAWRAWKAMERAREY